MAKRYGLLPSEVMKTSIEDYHFNLFVANQGIVEENKNIKKANKRG